MELNNFPALRPPPGKPIGRPVKLKTNLFKFTGTLCVLHEYHVKFTPEIHRKMTFDVFLRAMERERELLKDVVFDGTSVVVSQKKIPDQSIEVGEERIIKVDIVYRDSHDLRNTTDLMKEASHYVRCMEAATRFKQRVEFVYDMGKVFGHTRDGVLGAGLDLRTGIFHCIKTTVKGLFMNVDLAFSAFYRAMPVLDLLLELYIESRGADGRREGISADKIDLQKIDLGRGFYNDLEKFLRNVRVKTTHRGPGRKELVFRVSEIQQQSANCVEFSVNGIKTNVAKYFSETYKPLKYPNLPLVVVRKGGICLHFPMEVLEIFPDQKYGRKLDEQQTSVIVRHAAIAPVDRFKMIEEKAEKFKVLKNLCSDSFGIIFDNEFAECEGKVLDPPVIRFDNSEITPQKGSWNLRGVRAISPVVIKSWMLIAFRGRPEEFKSGIDCLMDLASKYGMKFMEKPKILIVQSMEEFVKSSKAPFCLVVLPDKNGMRYSEIKRSCETYEEIVTQCILAKNARCLNNPAFVGNLLLKINSKLGGINSRLKVNSVVLREITLVLAIDVSHPDGGDLESPSIVAVVGSMDANMTGYRTVIKQQLRRQEIVEELKSVTMDMLRSFYARNKAKPTQIIVFRDGVGESMFHTVFHTEILAIKDACASMETGYSPKMTFIIAQKRHSIRFLNTASANERCYNGNVSPGTVIEDIGHPILFDFFLVSHYALHGTARPIRYLVLLNESNFTREIIYNFVYGMCHVYARATKAVSVVPPIYYAHLAAARGKSYLEKDKKSQQLILRNPSKSLSNKLFYL